jgi:hypothetical protein
MPVGLGISKMRIPGIVALGAALGGCAFVLVLAVLSSCAARAEDQGRWVVVPATSTPVVASATNYIFAWRLDTKTGTLEMCTYDPGGWINATTKLPAPETG